MSPSSPPGSRRPDPDPPAGGERTADEMAGALLAFVRGFGLHRPDTTPCGALVPVAEAHALLELAAGPLGQSELGRRLDLAKSTVSRLVSQLEQRGWVERSPDGDDRRASRLTLTDSGHAAAAQLAGARRARFAALLDAVPPDRRDDVLSALDVLTAAARRSEPRHA